MPNFQTGDLCGLADLMFHSYYPFLDEGGGDVAIADMIAALRWFARDYLVATFVQRHGPLATAADVVHYANYLDYLRVHVKQTLDDGKDIDVVEESIDLSGWNLGFLPSSHDNQLTLATAASNIRVIYRLLSAANTRPRPRVEARWR